MRKHVLVQVLVEVVALLIVGYAFAGLWIVSLKSDVSKLQEDNADLNSRMRLLERTMIAPSEIEDKEDRIDKLRQQVRQLTNTAWRESDATRLFPLGSVVVKIDDDECDLGDHAMFVTMNDQRCRAWANGSGGLEYICGVP